MPSNTDAILLAAIRERTELIQELWFFGFPNEAVAEYAQVKALKARLREVRRANSGPSNPGIAGHPQAE
jgi:hypothetical protein